MDIAEVQLLMAEADKVGQVPLIESLHGIGKSSICANYAKENNLHYEPLILSLMDTGDLLGIPKVTELGGMSTTVWSAPDWYSRIVNAAWPTELKFDRLAFADDELQTIVQGKAIDNLVSRADLNTSFSRYYDLPGDELQLLRQDKVVYKDSKRSVLFLDEFNRAPADILNASLQLVLENRLHSHILPVVNGMPTMLIAAVNPADGNYTVAAFDDALLDRFIFCDLAVDAKAWSHWATKTNVNQVVRDYISENPKKLHYVPKEGGKGASPRSWERVAKYLDSINDTPTSVTTYYIKGLIGDHLAAEFIMYLDGYVKSMSVEQLEEIVTKASKRIKDVEKLGEKIAKETKDLESIKKMELVDALYDKYKNAETYAEAKPYLAFLYSLPMENLASYLTTTKSDNDEGFRQLIKLDEEANNKNLFRRFTSKATL